jgi:hypothetical protein
LLDLFTIINGISSLIFVIICIIVGFLIIIKYQKFKDKNFLYVGIGWIGLSEAWWSSSVSFIVALFNGTGLGDQAYLFIGNFFLPIFILLWLLAMEDLINLGKKHIIPIVFSICSAIYEIFFLYFLITDFTFLGKMQGPVDVNFSLFLIIYLFIALMIFFVTGTIFAISSLRTEDPRIKLKGKFLVIAFISFLLGTAFDIIATNPITRSVLVLSAIFFYIGYILPPAIENLILKK